jgi:hypothetical protein
VAADSGPIIREAFASISADAGGISETGLTVAILSRCLLQLENLQNTLKCTLIWFHKGAYAQFASGKLSWVEQEMAQHLGFGDKPFVADKGRDTALCYGRTTG